MKILAFVEGVSESGGTRADDYEGAVSVLIRRVIGDHTRVDFDRVANVNHRDALVRGGTVLKKAVAAMVRARGKGYDAAVFLIDQDKPKFADRVKQLDAAQECPAPDLPRAMGVPIMEFEAWLLADEVAIRKGLAAHDGHDHDPVPAQPDPETHIKDAKAALETIVVDRSKRKLYAYIAEHLRCDHVATRCPKGFGVFQKRLLAMRRPMSSDAEGPARSA